MTVLKGKFHAGIDIHVHETTHVDRRTYRRRDEFNHDVSAEYVDTKRSV